ncbi:MAG: cytochrome c biogenesis protein CcdA [bacterium]
MLLAQGTTESVLAVDSKLSVENIPVGAEFNVVIILKVAKEFHINSHTPTYDYLIPTGLELEQKKNIILVDLTYPKGNTVQFEFAEKPLDVYEETVTIFLTLKLSANAKPGMDTLRATVLAQACNDQTCLPPGTINAAIPLTIVDKKEKPALINKELFRNYESMGSASGGASPRGPSNEIAKLFDEQGSFAAFIAIFLIGLALNLTPCVYPMLSVTVSLFGSQTETNYARVFLKAVAYVLGIISMYTTLGVTAALSGSLFGSWLQSPWVLGGIGILLIGLSLSSLGVYRIQLPYWLTSRLGGTTGTGSLSLFISGLVVGVFAAPCIGPPVIALLTFVGSRADIVLGFWIFLTLSLGLSLPYLILGTFSNLIKKIPRSGGWLIWVERLFGVILSAAGIFYFALAFAPSISSTIIPLVFIIGGIYLGFFEKSGQEKKRLTFFKWAFGIIAILFGLYLGAGLLRPGMQWEAFSDEKIAEARSSKQPVMMDFYADWCLPCKELELNTFKDSSVIAMTQGIKRLKVNLTLFDSPEAEALRKKYSIAGVPTILFLGPEGLEVPGSRVVGFLPPNKFNEKIKLVTK